MAQPTNQPTPRRAAGYYWIRLKLGLSWQIAQHDGTNFMQWAIMGSSELFDENEVGEVGPKIEITPPTQEHEA